MSHCRIQGRRECRADKINAMINPEKTPSNLLSWSGVGGIDQTPSYPRKDIVKGISQSITEVMEKLAGMFKAFIWIKKDFTVAF